MSNLFAQPRYAGRRRVASFRAALVRALVEGFSDSSLRFWKAASSWHKERPEPHLASYFPCDRFEHAGSLLATA